MASTLREASIDGSGTGKQDGLESDSNAARYVCFVCKRIAVELQAYDYDVHDRRWQF
jgi:hypothetical protein